MIGQEEARSTIYRMLDELEFGRTDVGVRVNAMTSGLAEDDMTMTLMAKRLPTTIILPKVDDTRHIEWVCFPSMSLSPFVVVA